MLQLDDCLLPNAENRLNALISGQREEEVAGKGHLRGDSAKNILLRFDHDRHLDGFVNFAGAVADAPIAAIDAEFGFESRGAIGV